MQEFPFKNKDNEEYFDNYYIEPPKSGWRLLEYLRSVSAKNLIKEQHHENKR